MKARTAAAAATDRAAALSPAVSPFDFRHHWRTLFHTPPLPISATTSDDTALSSAYIPALTGLRAILCLLMMFYHAYEFLVSYISAHTANQLWFSPALWPLPLGPIIVDWFFVLTGLLIMLPVCLKENQLSAKAHKDNEEPALLSLSPSEFYYRRFSRLLPLWLLTYCVHHFLLFPQHSITREALRNEGFQLLFASSPDIDPNGDVPSLCSHTALLPVQLLSLSHLLPFGGCQGSTWSVALQMQFILVFPIIFNRLRSTRRLLPVLIAVLVVSTVFRVLAFFHIVALPLLDLDGATIYFWWYSNTITRIGTIAMGAVLAMVLTARRGRLASVRNCLRRPSVIVPVIVIHCVLLYLVRGYSLSYMEGPGGTLLLRTQSAIIAATGALPSFPPTGEQLSAIPHYSVECLLYVFGIAGGSLLTVTIAAIVGAIIVNPTQSLLGPLRQLFESPALTPLAVLSYAAYLIHPSLQIVYYNWIVTTIDRNFAPSVPVFLCHSLATVALSVVLAVALHVGYDSVVTAWLDSERVVSGWKHRVSLYYARVCLVASILLHSVAVPVLLLAHRPKGELTVERFVGQQ